MIADAMYVGDATIDRVMLGDVEVWSAAPVTPDLPVVTITGASSSASRNQFRAACVEYGTTYQAVTELPFLLDTSQAARLDSMFRDCASLVSVPDMDTSGVTGMDSMFRDCASLVSVPDMDTSSVTNMAGMFRGCSSLTSVSDLDTSNTTDMSNMFYGCSLLVSVPDMDTSGVTGMPNMFRDCASLTDGNVRLIGKHPSVLTALMIDGSGLTREPFYDTNGNPI